MFTRALAQKKNNKRAFTLIELIVVIGILAVLIAILVPVMTGIVNDARQATANANARTVFSIAQAEQVFAIVNGGGAMPEERLKTAVQEEMGDEMTGTIDLNLDTDDGTVLGASYSEGGVTGTYGYMGGGGTGGGGT